MSRYQQTAARLRATRAKRKVSSIGVVKFLLDMETVPDMEQISNLHQCLASKETVDGYIQDLVTIHSSKPATRTERLDRMDLVFKQYISMWEKNLNEFSIASPMDKDFHYTPSIYKERYTEFRELYNNLDATKERLNALPVELKPLSDNAYNCLVTLFSLCMLSDAEHRGAPRVQKLDEGGIELFNTRKLFLIVPIFAESFDSIRKVMDSVMGEACKVFKKMVKKEAQKEKKILAKTPARDAPNFPAELPPAPTRLPPPVPK